MEDVFKPKGLLIMAALSLGIGCLVLVFTYGKKSTQITFCDVGQGDAAYIRMGNGKDMLIDAGESRDVLDCLGAQMPPFDTYIDVVVLTHPHTDHYGGLTHVLKRYRVGIVLVSPYRPDSTTYEQLMIELEKRHIPVRSVYEGQSIALGKNHSMDLLWPAESVVTSKAYADDANAYSVVFLYREGMFEALFTGDIGPSIVGRLNLNNTKDLDVLKIPHHGSDNGITKEFLLKNQPAFSVISVGTRNRYGHPSPNIISFLKELDIPYSLTSEDGHISLTIHPDGTFSR